MKLWMVMPAFVALPLAAHADQWAAKAKLVNGSCGQGVVADVTENGQDMRFVFTLNGKLTADVSLKVAADGSGRTTFAGSTDQMTSLEVPAGKGKRPFKTGQMTKGICQWVWE